MTNEKFKKNLSKDDLRKVMGPPIFQAEKAINNDIAGVVTGLAWTSVGGEILFVEVSLSKGKGDLTLTGNLGDVMKESASIALAYLKAHAASFGIDPDVFSKWNVHIHVPEGATPKDGPSAGITMFTALASAFTQRKVREKMAMTGEITLRGRVSAGGRDQRKDTGCQKSRYQRYRPFHDNKKEIEDINLIILKDLTFHYIGEMTEVNNLALLKGKVKNPVHFI